jgi:hypothetical protein
MSPSLLQEERSAKHVLQTLKELLNVDVPDAQLILGLTIYTLSAAEWMPVGQLFCGLERTAISALSLCVFCTVGLRILVGRRWRRFRHGTRQDFHLFPHTVV